MCLYLNLFLQTILLIAMGCLLWTCLPWGWCDPKGLPLCEGPFGWDCAWSSDSLSFFSLWYSRIFLYYLSCVRFCGCLRGIVIIPIKEEGANCSFAHMFQILGGVGLRSVYIASEWPFSSSLWMSLERMTIKDLDLWGDGIDLSKGFWVRRRTMTSLVRASSCLPSGRF